MQRTRTHGPIAIGLALLLTACASVTSGVQTQAWIGTSEAGGASHPLVIATTLTPAGAWTGAYTVQRTPPFTGDIDATLIGGVLAGTLVVSPDCSFELAGTVSGDQLDAAFAPTGCPGGEGGTWTATRSTTPTSGAAPDPATDVASFDGAAFDATRFR